MEKRTALAALVGAGAATAVLSAAWLWHRRRHGTRAVAPPALPPPLPGAGGARRPTPSAADAAAEKELLAEQLSRNQRFFGDEGLAAIRDSFVVVVGLGGVGSHAAHMLVRSGVGRIRLVDFDNVTLSSLNRHATAVRADVGKPKVTAMARYLAGVTPQTDVDARVEMFTAEAAEALLAGNPDFVLDCIDDVATKTDLLAFCHAHDLPVVSSMAAGAKADPTRLHICDLADVLDDALAARVRYFLRKRGVTRGITAFGALDNFRVRVLPVLGTTPAVFGNAAAAHVLCHLAKQPFLPDPAPRVWQPKTINYMYKQLCSREAVVFHNPGPLGFGEADLEELVRTVYKYCSPVSGDRARLTATRWDKTAPLTLHNVVLLTKKEASTLDKAPDNGVFGEEVQRRVAHALALARRRLSACLLADSAAR